MNKNSLGGFGATVKLRAFSLSVLILWLAACSTAAPHTCDPGMQAMRSESLYFGTAMPNNQHVSDEDWREFLSQVATPRFPNGLTVINAAGQWVNKDGQLIVEQSYLINIVHNGEAKQIQALAEIVSVYKLQFKQESVLQLNSPVCATF